MTANASITADVSAFDNHAGFSGGIGTGSCADAVTSSDDSGPVLSECVLTQKVLLVLGGNDGSPVFTRLSVGNIRTRRGVYPDFLEVSRGLRLAHLSSTAAHGVLRVFTRYGSCAYLLGKVVDVISDCSISSDEASLDKPVAPSLSCLLSSPTGSFGVDYEHYNWSWNTTSPGFVASLTAVWTDWNIIISDLHRRFVSSLHKEFSGMEAIPRPNSDAFSILYDRRISSGTCSPLMDLYVNRRSRYVVSSLSGVSCSEERALLDFKLTLSNLEHHLHPFLLMLDGIVNVLELLLTYLDRYSLSVTSLDRVAGMLMMLHLRSCEHGQRVTLRSFWKFMLYHTLQSVSVLPFLGELLSDQSVDPALLYMGVGGRFPDLVRVHENAPHLISNSNVNCRVASACKALDDVANTEHHVLKYLHAEVAERLECSLREVRAALEKQYHFSAYLSYLNGVCCLQFGDRLDPLFFLLVRQQLPLHYQARITEVLYDCVRGSLVDLRQSVLSSLTESELMRILCSFDYYVNCDTRIPNLSLQVSTAFRSELSHFLCDSTMLKYSQILCHMLELQSFYSDVKTLSALSCRSSGIVCGFFVPRVSLLLIHVASALDGYYRWILRCAWSTLCSQLSGLHCMPDMVSLHCKYVDFLLDCLLVPVADCEVSTPRVGLLFSESLCVISACASELTRVLRDPSEVATSELESLSNVLTCEVSRLRSILNVVCSFFVPDTPVFGPCERAILCDVIRHGLALDSGSCKALSVLQRLLR